MERPRKIKKYLSGMDSGPRIEAGISLICRNPNHLVGINGPADRRITFYETQSFVLGHDLKDEFNVSSASAPKTSK
jgi:hypothetical protein